MGCSRVLDLNGLIKKIFFCISIFSSPLLQASIVSDFCRYQFERLGWIMSSEYHGHEIQPMDFEDYAVIKSKGRIGSELYTYEQGLLLKNGSGDWLDKIIEKLEAEGGEVRVLDQRGFMADRNATDGSYFRLSSESGKPMIAIARNARRDHVEHEFQHFLNWQKKRNEFVATTGRPRFEVGYEVFMNSFQSPMQMYREERTAALRQSQYLETIPQNKREQERLRLVVHGELSAINKWLNYLRKKEYQDTFETSQQRSDLMAIALWRLAHHYKPEIRRLQEKQKTKKLTLSERKRLSRLLNPDNLTDGLEVFSRYDFNPLYHEVMNLERSKLKEFLESENLP